MAVRIDATGDYLQRTANLPSNTAFTVCGWSRVTSDRGATTSQPLVFNSNGSTDAWALQWSSTFFSAQMRVSCITGGTESSGASMASRPAVGDVFFWYVKCSGTGAGELEGGWRAAGSTTFVTAAATQSGSLATLNDLRIGNLLSVDYLDGMFWNVKCWDRALTASEIEAESYFERVKFPSSLNFHWPLPNASRTEDISGNGRNPTVGGTLTTEDNGWQPWRPGARIIVAGTIDTSGGWNLTGTGPRSVPLMAGGPMAAGTFGQVTRSTDAGGGPPATTRGMPFNYGSAFNGGRIFVGPLQ